MGQRNRIAVVLLTALTGAAAVFWLDPISQDAAYHHFSDQRTVGGIANFGNVVSNLAFVLVGIYGLYGLGRARSPSRGNAAGLAFFAGLVLTGMGSAFYHYQPNNFTLVWDRVPMTISFMAFFSFILCQHLHERLGAIMLWPLLAIGIGSVIFWYYTEGLGQGDLRPYALVQYLPMVLTPLIMLLFPGRGYEPKYIWAALGLYAVAKVAEYFDAGMLATLGVLSGHTVKHLLAAAAGLALYKAFRSARPG